MKIIHRDKKEGVIKLKPEVLDDLWYLKSVIQEGDLVSGRSYRRIRDEEKLRADKGERVPVSLDIAVENVEFHPSINRLRITGKIKKGPEDLISLEAYHTLDVQLNNVISIKKEWKQWQFERLKEAEKAAKTPLALVVAVEDGEAEFALMRRYGVDFIVRITSPVSGKRLEKEHEVSVKEFYAKVASKLQELFKKEDIKGIIIGGPGFTKENLLAHLKDRYPKVAEICRLEGTGSGGKTGVYEVIKRGAVERVAEDSRVSLETMLVERLFKEIAKDSGLCAYGLKEVRSALDYGAVEKLLLSDVYLRTDEECDKFIKKVKKAGGEAIIVSTEHEAGERLQSLGGIAALLRFRV
ncbi:MAG: mRNA surveillance protein pelota [Candidatus Hydrothermarchaeales archaeon]